MKNFTAETFIQYRFPSNPRISPDGKLTAFVLRQADLEKNSYPGDVWTLCNETGAVRRLTAQGDALDYTWTPDGQILFPAPRGRAFEQAKKEGRLLTQYFVIDPQGGEAVELCTLPLQGGVPHILSDGRWLVVGKVDLNRPDFAAMDEKERKAALEEYDNPRYRVFEELPWWGNGLGDVSRRRNSLFLCDPAAGTAEKVTPDFFAVSDLCCDFGKVLYTGCEYRDFLPLYEGLYLLDTATGESRTLIEPGAYRLSFAHLLDEKTAVVALAAKEAHPYAHGDLYLVDLESGGKKLLMEYDRSVGGGAVASDARLGGGLTAKAENGRLYFITGEDDESYLRWVDKDGNRSERLAQPGSVDCFDIRGGKIVLSALRGDRLPELYSLGADGAETRLTSFNDWVSDDYAVSTPQPLRFTASDGFEIHGWVMPPVGYQPGNKYPAILHIHGGPRTVFGSVFHNEMQLWASSGYFVLFCNPRGGDGRGQDFADLLGKYGDVDYKNLMEFTDECLKKYPDIDAENVGVTGGSYGGFMTNWIIGHTDRFKAACSQRSIANWITFEGTTDIGYWFTRTQHGALTETNAELLWNLSPLKYAANAKTPTLFIHSEEDYRCFMSGAFAMFTTLKMHGVESRIALFRGENHDLSRTGRPRARIRRMEEIVNWMNAHLKG